MTAKKTQSNSTKESEAKDVCCNKYFFHLFAINKKISAIVWNTRGEISRLFLPESNSANLEKKILDQFKGIKNVLPPKEIKFLIKQIENYFLGKPCKLEWSRFDLKKYSPFARKIYLELLKIKHGNTITYKELAAKIGNPSAARAVGTILGKNPIPLLIPCHRVIKSDGSVGGFSAEGGASQKIAMLALEGIKFPSKTLKIDTPSINNYEIDTAIKAISYADPDLAVWIKKLPRFNLALNANTTIFQALLEAIVYQQLTGKAAATIYTRLLDLFGTHKITPLDIIRARDSELRKAGLSGPKILAIRDLAEKDLAGMLPDMKSLSNMCDDEIIQKLVNIRGIGRWTAEMVLIFKLGRLDVLPVDDYGLKKGLAILRNYQKLPSPKQLAHEGRIWRPYRTVASWYLWRIAESVKRI